MKKDIIVTATIRFKIGTSLSMANAIINKKLEMLKKKRKKKKMKTKMRMRTKTKKEKVKREKKAMEMKRKKKMKKKRKRRRCQMKSLVTPQPSRTDTSCITRS